MTNPAKIPRAAPPWRRELRSLARLSAPVAATQIGMLLMGTVDTMMLGRVSKEALAAGALGHAVSFAIFAPVMGVLLAIESLVTQAHGAGNSERVARHSVRMAVLAVYLTLPVMALLLVAGPRLDWFRQSPELIPLAADYLVGIVPGALGFFWFFALRLILQAMGVVRPALLSVVAANVINVVANYALVFGGFGFPALGVYGSAIATSISRWALFLMLLAAGWPVLRSQIGRHLSWALVREALPLRAHGATLRLGLPIALHNSAEFWVFTAVGLMMGSLGAVQFAAHQIALNLAALTFMVPLGVAGAAAARVGNAVGRLDSDALRISARVSLALGAGVMSIFGVFLWLFPRVLARAYSPDPEVIAMAALLIPIAAVFQIADGTQVVASGVLRGAADTKWPALIALVGFWFIGLPLGAVLAFRRGLGPAGLWWGLTLGLVATALFLMARLRFRLAQPIGRLRAERD